MDPHQSIQHAMELISRMMGELEARAFQHENFSELSMRQLFYLETIARMDAPPTFSELAVALGVTRPSVTNIVKKLIDFGYVEKVQSAEDLRVYHINLAPRGRQFTENHDRVHRLMAERLTRNLNDEEIEQMAALLRKVVGGQHED